ncbi:hypothetical protein KKI24_08220 [bacterium]|nr:hypothetical protein [bacterium]
MLVEDLDVMYEETYKKNDEIQTHLVEVRDHNEILDFLYETEIQKPNLTLNSMIDTYESLILKLRELHADMMNSLAEFGDEKSLAAAISENDSLGEKVKGLMLWKLRRIFMVYDKEPVLPYTEGPLSNLELISDGGSVVPARPESEDEEEQEEPTLPPKGGVFSNSHN